MLTLNELVVSQGQETVYLLDFVGPRGFAQELAASCLSVKVVDHHKTAAEALGSTTLSNLDVTLDMQHSAAVLALQHFKPQVPSKPHAAASQAQC